MSQLIDPAILATLLARQKQQTAQAQVQAQQNQAQQTQQPAQQPAQPSVGNPLAGQQQPDLGNQQPANITPEQAQAGKQNATGANAKSWWNQVGQNISGYGLEGDALQQWQNNMAMSMLLGSLGSAVGGDSFGGRLGQGLLNFGQGAIAGRNAMEAEKTLFDLLRGSSNATSGVQPPAATEPVAPTEPTEPGKFSTVMPRIRELVQYLGV